MLKYFVLSLSLFFFHNEDSLFVKNASLGPFCIIYLIVSLIAISILIYYGNKQLKQKEQSILSKDKVIKQRELDLESSKKMIKVSQISNEEVFRVYRLMVCLSISPQSGRYQKFLRDYNSIIHHNNEEFRFDWVEFHTLLNNIYDGYLEKLELFFPNLSEKEVQVISMQKAGFDIPDIARIFEYSVNTIYKRNSDIRKKLGVPESGNIIHFIDRNIAENYCSIK